MVVLRALARQSLALILFEVTVVVERQVVMLGLERMNVRRRSVRWRYGLNACFMKTTMPAWSYQASWISLNLPGLHHKMLQRA